MSEEATGSGFATAARRSITVKTVEKQEDVKALLEVGFEYICQKDNLIFLRKRK